jgi:Double zinc ribbon
MLCTFCGTENRPEYKFCGMCGVRLERRQVERRVSPGLSMKCPACNHVNDPGLKFCGMCGTRVERRVQERRATADEPRAAAIANAQLPTPDSGGRVSAQVVELPERRAEVPISRPRRDEPAIFRNERIEPANESRLLAKESNIAAAKESNISGPSFLGLNNQQSGNDVEYLLEDEPSGGGLRKLILLVIIAAIVGLVFMQWRSSLKANPKAVPAKTDPATAPQGENQPPAAASQPAEDAAKNAGNNSDPDAVAASEAKDKPAELAAPASDSANSSVPAAGAAEIPADKKPSGGTVAQPGADSKPEDAKLADYKPSPALVRAQQYLRGRGVQQNCEQGLLYLHAATDKSDPGAAIQMAALYSSGVCVKQDRVMAYRWFNSAHELQPGNVWIQKNMDQLWAQMSSQERRLSGY